MRTDTIHATAPMQIAEGVDQPEGGVRRRHRRQRHDLRRRVADRRAGRLAPPARDPRRGARAQPPVRAQRRRRRRERRARRHAGRVQPVLLRRSGRSQVPDDQRRRHRRYVRRHRRPMPNNWRFYRYRVYERVIPLAQRALGELRMKPRRRARFGRSPARRGAVRRADRPHHHDAGRAGAAAPDGRRHVDRRQRRVQGKRDLGRRPRHRVRAMPG